MVIDISKAKNVKNFGIEYGNLSRQAPYSTEWVYKMFNPDHQTPTAKELQSKFTLIHIDTNQFILPKEAVLNERPHGHSIKPAPATSATAPHTPAPTAPAKKRSTPVNSTKPATKKQTAKKGLKSLLKVSKKTPAKAVKKDAPKKRGRKPGSIVVGRKTLPGSAKRAPKVIKLASKKTAVKKATGAKRGPKPGSKKKAR